MIFVCEPQCKGVSHEKFNAGFLYGLSQAFPNDKIILFADQTHINALQSILIIDEISLKNIEYKPIQFDLTDSFGAFIKYYFLCIRIFKNILTQGGDKLFLLSFSPKILYIIKRLKERTQFRKLKFTLVLHGDFENIATDTIPAILIPIETPIIVKRTFLQKLRTLTPLKLVRIIYHLLDSFLKKVYQKLFFNQQFPTKKILLWKMSSDFKYLALSPHVLENAKKYIDVNALQITAIVLPTIFAKQKPVPQNSFIKFGVFGFGNSKMLREIARRLEKKVLEKPYEIRIIGMDNNGLEQFPNIKCPKPGKQLSRSEMEEYAVDVDMFLILYDKSRYRLSCSGSILESLSYCKPVLHFDNECIAVFDTPIRPIGISCNSIDEYVNVMTDIINNYQSYQAKFNDFRTNISAVRKEVAVENFIPQIKASFTW